MQGRRRIFTGYKRAAALALSLLLLPVVSGCGGASPAAAEISDSGERDAASPETPLPGNAETLTPADQEEAADPWQESAADGEIDFTAQASIRPDMIGWLYVPGTDIDCPVYVGDHGEGVFLDDTCSPDMIDYNETLHGKAEKKGDVFSALYSFTDPAFFEEHTQFFFYSPYGTMSYGVIAAWETEDADLDISLLEGTEEEKAAFLDEMKALMIGKNIRQEITGAMTTSNFYLTLSAKQRETSDRQFLVVGLLAGVG